MIHMETFLCVKNWGMFYAHRHIHHNYQPSGTHLIKRTDLIETVHPLLPAGKLFSQYDVRLYYSIYTQFLVFVFQSKQSQYKRKNINIPLHQ